MHRFPLLVSLGYAFASATWIAVSDRFVSVLFGPDAGVVQTYKGWFFVAVTAILLCWVLDREWARRKRSEDALAATVAALKQNEAALGAAKGAAEEATAAKSRFMTGVTHDLRQPLQAITFHAASLADSIEDERGRTALRGIAECASMIEAMLRELRATSERGQGNIGFEPSAFVAGDLLRGLEAVFAGPAAQKKLRLTIVPSRAVVFTDATILERILSNLLSNAIRYTASGRVLIGCRRRRDCLRISIIDTGPGIPEGELSGLFDGSHQGLPRAPGSQGVGLGVAKTLADAAGLRIDVQSRLGAGSTFTVTVPLAAPLH